MEHLATRFAEIPGVVAVSLGGSRVTGRTARTPTFWDLGLYYRGTIDAVRVDVCCPSFQSSSSAQRRLAGDAWQPAR